MRRTRFSPSVLLRTCARHYVTSNAEKPTVDLHQIAKFAPQAAKWWHPNGSAAPLHRMNPTRIAYIRSVIERHIRPSVAQRRPLADVELIDVGCGGGLVAEPIARLGANVLAIDMSEEGLSVARAHAATDPLLVASNKLEYRHAAVEHLVQSEKRFDVVLALEIIEHVSDPSSFIRHCSTLVREGGVLIVSTLNRTAASYALAIVAAERILRWLPRGTHEWSKFITPQELSRMIETESKLVPDSLVGVTFNPLSATFSITDDTSMNYILSAKRPVTSDS